MNTFKKFVKNQVKIKRNRDENRNFYLSYFKKLLRFSGLTLIFIGVTLWATPLAQYGIICLLSEEAIALAQGI